MNSELKTPVLEMRGVCRSFKQGKQSLQVLRGVDLEIAKGEIVALIGPSGSGKSTLLQLAGLLEKPTKGDIYLEGRKCSNISDNVRTALRKDYLGFVYQYHNLLGDFSALENVMIPQLRDGVKVKQAKDRAQWLLKRLGLETMQISSRHSCPAVNSKGWLLPEHWQICRNYCWQMSQPVIWIRKLRILCSPNC